MSLTDIVAGILLIEAAVYGTKGLVFYLKYHKSNEKPSRFEKLYALMPPPLDSLYFLKP